MVQALQLRQSLRVILIFGIAVCCGIPRTRCFSADSSFNSATPDWQRLENFSGAMLKEQFVELLGDLYAPYSDFRRWARIDDDTVTIKKSLEDGSAGALVAFARSDEAALRILRYWRTKSEIAAGSDEQPLSGLNIALDPGHIGGGFAEMEERSFQIDGGESIREGDLTLKVATILRKNLKALGATVTLVRENSTPVTDLRPEGLLKRARKRLAESVRSEQRDRRELRAEMVGRMSEWLFYRVEEIRSRAEKVNCEIQPDIVIALHFDAVSQPEVSSGAGEIQPVAENHLHVLVNGAYLPEELADDRIRQEMFVKLFQQTAAEEIPVAGAIANAMAEETGLLPFRYDGRNAARVNDNPYVWARNLIANRLYECPVVYLEPYVLNNRVVIDRVLAGDYEGVKVVAGKNAQKHIPGVCGRCRRGVASVLSAIRLIGFMPTRRASLRFNPVRVAG